MPVERLIFILVLVLVMAAAAATIAVVSAAMDGLQAAPITGFAILSLSALCAAYLWRRYSNRNDN